MSIPLQREAVRDRLVELVAASGLRSAYVEMICTRGQPAPGSRDPRTCTNRFLAFAVPFIWIADPEKQETGLHLVISHRQRIPPASVDPAVKNYHWLDMVNALFEAYDRGGETAVTVDVLPGVTRRTVSELTRERGHEVCETEVPAASVRAADEVFATSTAGGLMPITRVDGRPIGTGRPGPITLGLREAYWALHEDPDWTLAVDYGCRG